MHASTSIAVCVSSVFLGAIDIGDEGSALTCIDIEDEKEGQAASPALHT